MTDFKYSIGETVRVLRVFKKDDQPYLNQVGFVIYQHQSGTSPTTNYYRVVVPGLVNYRVIDEIDESDLCPPRS